MLLKSIAIGNYKSFQDEVLVDVGAGFNVFIGANNSGKTTMLEALDFRTDLQTPHRSIWSLPKYGQQPIGASSQKLKIETSLSELRSLLGTSFAIPIPEMKDMRKHPSVGVNFAQGAYELLFQEPELFVTFDCANHVSSMTVETCLGESKQLLDREGFHQVLRLQFTSQPNDAPNCSIYNEQAVQTRETFSHEFKRFFYRFSAQRIPSSHSQYTGYPLALLPDASNLAFCLSQLQLNDAHGHKILCEWVNRVFPSIQWVQAPALAANQWHIQCLPRQPSERRDDLAIPIQQMGTGIGNVIAIMYVVLTARHPQVIAIDEPNSFLHPKALRELLQILAIEGGHHQYILTAHSADVLTAVRPTFVTMFSSIEGRTSAKQVTSSDISELRADLSDLGIRMTDLHGRDRVLWVEGQTEELVMPELLRYFCPDIAAGTAVLRVEHTGTFEKKKGMSPVEIARIYQRLSESSALVPPTVCILLDREGKETSFCEQMEDQSSGVLRYLERTMLEDYVLDPDAITAVLLELGEQCTSQDITNLLASDENSMLSAAAKLENIFSSISNARHVFRKTRDTPSLVYWLLANKADYLNPLGKFLMKIIEKTI